MQLQLLTLKEAADLNSCGFLGGRRKSNTSMKETVCVGLQDFRFEARLYEQLRRKGKKKRKKLHLYRDRLKQTQMRWQILPKVILMVFILHSHLVTTSFHQWTGVLLKLFCHLLGLSFLTIFLFLQLECLLSHNLKVNGHQVCPHRCENTDSPVCLYWIILLPAQLGQHSYSPSL